MSPLSKRFLERRVSHLIRTLHLSVISIRRTSFQSPSIPYPGCRSSVREAPHIVPHEVHWPPRCWSGSSLACRKARKLRTRSAVAQRDIFHAEGSFGLCAFKNGFHKSLISHDQSWVGPQVDPDFGSWRRCQLLSVQFGRRDSWDRSAAVFSSTSRQSSTSWPPASPAFWF